MILFILLRIDYYLIMLSCLGTLERVMKDIEDMVEAMMTSKDVQQKPEARSNMILSLSRPPELVCLKLSPRMHPDSIFDNPHMVGKLT